MDWQTMVAIIVALVATQVGAAWGGVKMAMNGWRSRLERIERKVDLVGERVAVLDACVQDQRRNAPQRPQNARATRGRTK